MRPSDKLWDLWDEQLAPLLTALTAGIIIGLISLTMNGWLYQLLHLAPWAIWTLTAIFVMVGAYGSTYKG